MKLPKLLFNGGIVYHDEFWNTLYSLQFKTLPSVLQIGQEGINLEPIRKYLMHNPKYSVLQCSEVMARDRSTDLQDLLDEYEETEENGSSARSEPKIIRVNNSIGFWNQSKSILVTLNYNGVRLLYDRASEASFNEVEEFVKMVDPIPLGLPLYKINFLCLDSRGEFYLRAVTLPERKTDLALHYGENFLEIDEKLQSFLKGSRPGLVMLHGPPGTGKTSYIRYLLNKLRKNVIYVPPYMMDSLTSPRFLPFMLSNTDCVLVIEDGEEVLKKREEGRTGGVANLLNLTDGLLGESVRCQVVCTFNAKIKELDEALLRPGRLFLDYEFSALSAEEANKLFVHLGMPYSTRSSLILGEVFNCTEGTEKIIQINPEQIAQTAAIA